MTKEEIIKIIEQNKDILTPENFQGIVKDIDIFTELEWEQIANYLDTAHKLKQSHHHYIQMQNELYEKTGENLDKIQNRMLKGINGAFSEAEQKEAQDDKKQMKNIFSNL